MRARATIVSVLLVAAGCSDSPKRGDVPPPGSEGPPATARPAAPPRTTAIESSPVPANVRAILDEHAAGGLDARSVALAMEAVLADLKDDPLTAGSDWTVSKKRAVVHALLVAPSEVRSELQRYQDERARFSIGSVRSDLAANRLGRVVPLADRYPNASFAQAFWERLEKERAIAPREIVDAALLPAPVPPGGLKLGNLSVRGDGTDGLVCQDVDGGRVWEYHSRAEDGGSFRVLGTFADRLIAVETRKSGASVDAIDLATGSDVFKVALPDVKDSPHVALVGPEAVVAVPGRLVLVDLLRGKIGWQRAVDGLPVSVLQDRVVYGLEGRGYDLATGRRVEGFASKRARQGSIEVR